MGSKSRPLGLTDLGPLLAALAQGQEGKPFMDAICELALEVTGSGHVLIAVLNDEEAVLEVLYGAGEDFQHIGRSVVLPFDVGREDGIIGLVAATGKPFRTGNVGEVPNYRQMIPTSQSEVAVPIRDRHGRVGAVINAESDQADAYDDHDIATLALLGDLVALGLDRADRLSREEALIQIGSSLDTALTEEALIDRVIQVSQDTLSFQACSIFLLDPALDQFVLRGTSGRLKSKVGEIMYRRGEGFTGWVADRAEAVLIHDPFSDERWLGKYTEFPGEQVASYLAVPIVVRNKSIGVIRCLRRKTANMYLDNRFTEDDRRLLEAIAEQVAAGLENLRNMEKIIRSERMIAWGELSAKSSHMIGNRVFALKGDINELHHVLNSPELDRTELKDLQRSLSVNVTRIDEILRDFRDFVTATQVHREPSNLNQLVRETVQEVFPKRSGVRLVLRLADRLPDVEFDPKKLRRAVSELIENALNYMAEGTLRVETRLADRSEFAQLRVSRTKTYAAIEVEDSGPGVSEEDKARIFQPFFSQRVKGMGLGLSIVKGIVDAHGGEVFESGQPGQGARFIILLPVGAKS